jgi:autotransporter-associated beta strand protein
MRLDRLKLPRRLSCVFALVGLAAAAGPAAAQPDTWGAGTNNPVTDFRWFTPGNWSLGVPTTTSNATFTNTATGIINFAGGPGGSRAADTGTLTFAAGITTGYTIGDNTAGDQLTINAATGTNLTVQSGTNFINARLVATALNGSITGGSLTLANTAAGAAANSLTGSITVATGGTLTARIAGTVGAGTVATPNNPITGSSSLGNAAVTLSGGTLNLVGQLIGTRDPVTGAVTGGGATGQFFDINTPSSISAFVNVDGFVSFGTGRSDFFVPDQFKQLNPDFSGGTTNRTRANALLNQLPPKVLGSGAPTTTPTTVAVNAGQNAALTPPADVPNFYSGGLSFPNIGSGVVFGQNTSTVPVFNTTTNVVNVGQYAASNHMARFAGLLSISANGGGTYYFDTQSDDASLVYVDGKLVVYNNLDQGIAGTGRGVFGPINYAQGNPAGAPGMVNLAANTTHLVEVLYQQGGGGAGLIVNYTGPDAGGFNGNVGATGNIPAIALQGFQGKVSLTGNNVTLSGNSTINITQAFEADLGTLTFNSPNTLTSGTATSIGNGLLRFSATTLAAAAGGTYTVVASGTNDVALGTLTNTMSTGAIIKQGTQNLILDGGTAIIGAAPIGLSYSIRGGRLEAIADAITTTTNTNSLGVGGTGGTPVVTVGLDSTDGSAVLQLRARNSTSINFTGLVAAATFDNRINVTATTGALEIAPFLHPTNGAFSIPLINLGTAGGVALSIASGTSLIVDVQGGATFHLIGNLIGSGTFLRGDNPVATASLLPANNATSFIPPVYNGTGTMRLIGDTSTFTGSLVINTGTVIPVFTVNGTSTAPQLLGSGGSIVLDGPVFYNSRNAAGTGVQNSNTPGGGVLQLEAGLTYTGGAPITFKGGTLNNANGSGFSNVTNTYSGPTLLLRGLSTGVAAGSPTANFNGSSGTTLVLTTGFDDGGVGQGIAINSTGFTLNLQAPAVSLGTGTFVNINAGTLNSNNATALGAFAAVTLNPSNPPVFNVNASQTIGSINGVGTTNIGANTLIIGNTNNLTGSYSGTITGTGGQIIKNGTGTQTFSAASTYTGGTRVNAGTLVASHPQSLGTGTVTLAGGTLNVGNIPSVAGFNQDTIRAVVDPNTAPFGTTVSVDAPTGFGFYEQGVNTGQPTFGLPPSRTFTSFANSSVTFQLQPYTKNNALWLSTVGAAGTLTIPTPVTFNTLNILTTSGSGTSTWTAQLNFTDSTSTLVSGLSTTDWFGGANPALGGGGASPGLDRFNRGNGNFDNNGTNPRLYETDLTLSAADAAKLLSSITFTKTSATGTGFLNVYAISRNGSPLPTVVNSNYNNPVTALANTTSNITVSTLLAGTAATVNFGALTLQGGSVLNISPDAAALAANTGYTLNFASTALTGLDTISVANNGTGVGTLSPGALTDGGAGAQVTLTIAAPAAGTAGAVTLTAAGTITNPASAVNVNAGTLNLNAAGALGSLVNVTVASGAILNLGAGQTLGALNGAGLANLNGNALTVGNTNNLNSTFSGVIADGTGAGSLTKAGGPLTTLTLSGINTYSGGTFVNAGRLQANTAVSGANSATGTGAVTIFGGAVLGGGSAATPGAVGGTAGDVTLNAGATLNPGTNNAGTLTALRNVALAGGSGGGSNSNWVVGIGSASSGNAANLLNLNNAAGILSIVASGASPYNIDFEQVGALSFTQGTPVTYTIATVTTAGNVRLNGSAFPTTATTTGFTFTSSTIQFAPGSASLMANAGGTGLQLSFTPVPEPTTVLAVCAVGGAAFAAWRRRRQADAASA